MLLGVDCIIRGVVVVPLMVVSDVVSVDGSVIEVISGYKIK